MEAAKPQTTLLPPHSRSADIVGKKSPDKIPGDAVLLTPLSSTGNVPLPLQRGLFTPYLSYIGVILDTEIAYLLPISG